MIIRKVWNIKAFSAINECVDEFISLLPSILTLESNFRILGAPMGSLPFMESFISEVFQEDFNTIVNLPMFANP